MENESAALPETPQPKGALWRLQGIFFEPSATFEDINLKPGFIVPLAVSILITLIVWQVIPHFVDLQELFLAQARNNPQVANLSDDQIKAGLGFQVLIIKYFVPLLIPIMALIFAGVFLLMVSISGSETTFSRVFSVVSQTFFFQSLIGGILLVIVFVLAKDPYAINLQNPIFTNLGPLVDAKASPVLYKLASSVDILNFYVIYLLGLGISKVSRRMSVGKGVMMVVIPYLIYLAISVGITAVTAG